MLTYFFLCFKCIHALRAKENLFLIGCCSVTSLLLFRLYNKLFSNIFFDKGVVFLS